MIGSELEPEKPSNIERWRELDERTAFAEAWLAELRGTSTDEFLDMGGQVAFMNFTAASEQQWKFILITVSLATTDEELAAIAAGPVEHLLGKHGEYYIDWKSDFKAGDVQVVLERTPIEGQESGRRWGGYATLGLRINTETLTGISLLNNEGKRELDIHTSPTKWTDISGIIKDDSTKSAGIAIFDHNQNPRHPVPGYVINSENKNDWPRLRVSSYRENKT